MRSTAKNAKIRKPAPVAPASSHGLTFDAATLDAFANGLARIGYGTNNLLESTSYPLTRLSRNYILCQSLYRSSWIARKVIDAPAEDMTKNRFQLTNDLPPADLLTFDTALTDTGTEAALLTALKWGRLFGGAGAVIVIAGQGDQLDQPLDPDSVEIGAYRGLLVFDRWSGITPNAELNTDLDNPLAFGLPKSYHVWTETAQSFDVHASRVLRFIGRDLPMWEKAAEMRWGTSEFELLYQELVKRDNTSYNIASLIFRANILGLKIKDLAQMLSGLGKSQAALQQFNAVLNAQNQLMSNQGLLVLPEEGGIEQRTYTFAGINDVYQSFMMDIAGAAEIPVSRLFGRTTTGLSATGEGDEQIYYDAISQKQRRELAPQLKKLLPVIAMSTWGQIPKDLNFTFPPCRTMTAEEQAELASKATTAVVSVYNAGLISQRTALLELQQQADTTGLFTNITSADIEAADDAVQDQGEAMFGKMAAGKDE